MRDRLTVPCTFLTVFRFVVSILTMCVSGIPASRMSRGAFLTLGCSLSALSRHAGPLAPRPALGYANDSWAAVSIGWWGGEP